MDVEHTFQIRVRIDEITKFEPEPDLRVRILPVLAMLENAVHTSNNGASDVRWKPGSFELRERHGGSHGREYRRRLLSLRRWRITDSPLQGNRVYLTRPGPGLSASIAFVAYARACSTASRGVPTGTKRDDSTPALSIGHVRRAKTVLPRSKA